MRERDSAVSASLKHNSPFITAAVRRREKLKKTKQKTHCQFT